MKPLTKREKRIDAFIKVLFVFILLFVLISGKAQKVKFGADGNLYKIDTIPAKFYSTGLQYKDEMMVEHTVYVNQKGKYFYFSKNKKGKRIKKYLTIIQ